jgi:geranylgeranyl diphosphate synthase type II
MTTTQQFDLKAYMAERARRVESALEKLLPLGENLGGVVDMMRYGALGAGKRFRPVVCIAAAEALGFDGDRVMPSACAFEATHAFSLVHDDLPCMDNDKLRRGKPTCWVQYGEAEALLAGDGLMIDAFRMVALNAQVPGVNPAAVLAVVTELAQAAGHPGMVGGQMLDIQGMREKNITPERVREIHRTKTGALIRGAVRAGALLCDATPAQLESLTAYAERLGLVFQITDDLLDFAEKEESVSYPSVFGVDESRRLARQATDEALAHLKNFPASAEPLRELARFLLTRES